MSKAKILIIDDEIGLRDSLKRIVEKSGFIAETAMDFASAKKIVSKFKFDLFLVDLILPKMNGIQLMTRLKEEFEITGAILFFTGEPNLETCIEAIRLGALDYLEKPVEPSVLKGFSDVQCLVSTACPRIAFDDALRFDVPLLTPFEVDVLVGEKSIEDYRFDTIP